MDEKSIQFDDQSGAMTLTEAEAPKGTEAPILARGALVGRYIVADLIGRGGMGVVYKAFDPELNRPVALKLLVRAAVQARRSPPEDFAVHKARLLREAQALAQLSHPNVVTVFDVGTAPSDAVFMAMEFVEGKDLKDLLDEKQHAPAELLEILMAAGRGLAAAHKVGIVHRDFKPAQRDHRQRRPGAGARLRAGARGAHARSRTRSRRWPLMSPSGPSQIGSGSASDAAPARIDSSGSLLASALTQAGAIVGHPALHGPGAAPGAGGGREERPVQLLRGAVRGALRAAALLGAVAAGDGEADHPGPDRAPEQPQRRCRPGWSGSRCGGSAWTRPERYPSMEALLADLANDPAIARAPGCARGGCAGRRRWLLVVFAALGGLGDLVRDRPRGRGCAGRARRGWPGSGTSAVQGSGSGRPSRQDRAALRRGHLRAAWSGCWTGYAGDWVAARREACEATHVRGEQSEQLLDLRMQCLERRLGELRALTELFAAQADAEVVDKAVQAAAGPGSALPRCADTAGAARPLPPPEDPATRAAGRRRCGSGWRRPRRLRQGRQVPARGSRRRRRWSQAAEDRLPAAAGRGLAAARQPAGSAPPTTRTPCETSQQAA